MTLIPIVIIPFFFEIPAFIFLGFWFVMQFVNLAGSHGTSGGIAWWAHIGGFVFGIVLLKAFMMLPRTGITDQMHRVTAKRKTSRLQVIRPIGPGDDPNLYATIDIAPLEALPDTLEVQVKLLLVDDVMSFLELEKTFLSRAECTLLTASTGLEAIKVAEKEHPDLILLDVEMPEMNGIEATRILQNQPELKDIPIVIVSSSSMDQEALAAGAREFVKKPVDEPRFQEIVLRYVPLTFRLDDRRMLGGTCVMESEGEQAEGTVVDISISGLLLRSTAIFAIGDPLTLYFNLPGAAREKEIQAGGVVVRISEKGYGIRFTRISEGAVIFIREFVEG